MNIMLMGNDNIVSDNIFLNKDNFINYYKDIIEMNKICSIMNIKYYFLIYKENNGKVFNVENFFTNDKVLKYVEKKFRYVESEKYSDKFNGYVFYKEI